MTVAKELRKTEYENVPVLGIYYHGQGIPPTTAEEIKNRLLNGGLLACDTETVSLQDRTIIGVGFATSKDEAFYIPSYSPLMQLAKEVLEDPSILVTFYNAPFDLEVLAWDGIFVKGSLDLLTMARQHRLPGGLKLLASHIGWDKDEIRDLLGPKQTMMDLPEEVTADKCCWDVRITWELFYIMQPETDMALIHRDGLASEITAKMQKVGLAVDSEHAEKLDKPLVIEMARLRQLAEDETGWEVNPGSPDQVAYILGMRGVFLKVKKPKGGWTETRKARMVTDEAALLYVAQSTGDPLAKIVLEYRKTQKLRGYTRPFIGVARIHPHFHQDAATMRFSASGIRCDLQEPNEGLFGDDEWQQERRLNALGVPKSMRGSVVPDGKVFTRFDFSQQELRILAYMSGDRAMIEAASSTDMHQSMGDMMYVARAEMKNANFAVVYGSGLDTIATTAGISLHEAARLMGYWKKTFPDAWEWMEGSKQEGLRQGYAETATGRKLPLPEVGEGPEQVDEATVERMAVNYRIQGTGGDALRESIIILDEAGIDQRLPIHDELNADGAYMFPREKLEAVIPGMHLPIESSFVERWS